MFLIVIDVHSKWIEAFTVNTSTSSATVEKLRITIATHGLPEVVVTDNGRNFISIEFEDFLKQKGIRHITTAPYHPASNVMAEREVQTFKEGMKNMNGGSVETCVSRIRAQYRITPPTSTGVSPAELLLGRKPRSRLHLVYPEINRKVRQSQASQKLAHDWHTKDRTMLEGEAFYASSFRSGPKWIPGVLKQSTGPTSFAVQLEDGRLLGRHQDHLIRQSSAIQEAIIFIKRSPTSGSCTARITGGKTPNAANWACASQRSAILLGTDRSLDVWLILLLSDLSCYRTVTLKNCKIVFLLMLL